MSAFPQTDQLFLPQALKVQVHDHHTGGRLVRIAPTGELDVAGAPMLEAALGAAQATATHVILDLRGLTFCDSTGVHIVLNAANRARDLGGRLVVVPAPPDVHRVFELTGVDGCLRFATDLEAQMTSHDHDPGCEKTR